MNCPKCGQPLPEGARFCGSCGKKLIPEGEVQGVVGNEIGSSAGDSSSAASGSENAIPLAADEKQNAGIVRSGCDRRKMITAIAAIIAAVMIIIVVINLALSGAVSYESAEERWQEQYDLGERYLLEMDYDQAIEAFTKAISIDENNADAYLGRAEAYLGSDIHNASEENLYLALADYETAISLDDTRAEAFAGRGDVHRTMGSYEEALADYDVALEMDETLGEVYVGRGHVQYALGALEEALSDYETAIELGSADEEVYLSAAGISMELEDYERAVEILEEGQEAYPYSEKIREQAEEVEAVLEEEETRRRYQAYYDKLMELREEYGKSLELYDKLIYATGLSFAKLMDFDGDGEEEMVTACSWLRDEERSNVDYVVQIWSYDDGETVLLFESEDFTYTWLSYISYITISSSGGKDYLIDWYGSANWAFYHIYGEKDGTFDLLCSLENAGDASAGEDEHFYLDGTEVDYDTIEEALTQYEFDNREMYYFITSASGNSSNVSAADILDETIDFLEEYLSQSEEESDPEEGHQEEDTELQDSDISEVVDSGECGPDLAWTYYSDGKLIISGSGEMDEWRMSRYVPWGEYCNSIKSAIIEEGVSNIGDYAFYGCTVLTEATIPDGLIVIGEEAFAGCARLSSISIPDSVTSIGRRAFYHCESLTELIIPYGVTEIGKQCFSGCSSLVSVVLSDSVTSLGEQAFSFCTSLTSILLSCNLHSTGERAFANCTALNSIEIPEGIGTIGSHSFEHCVNLQAVYLPLSLKHVYFQAFEGCSELTDVYYAGSESDWADVDIALENEPLEYAAFHYNTEYDA